MNNDTSVCYGNDSCCNLTMMADIIRKVTGVNDYPCNGYIAPREI